MREREVTNKVRPCASVRGGTEERRKAVNSAKNVLRSLILHPGFRKGHLGPAATSRRKIMAMMSHWRMDQMPLKGKKTIVMVSVNKNC